MRFSGILLLLVALAGAPATVSGQTTVTSYRFDIDPLRMPSYATSAGLPTTEAGRLGKEEGRRDADTRLWSRWVAPGIIAGIALPVTALGGASLGWAGAGLGAAVGLSVPIGFASVSTTYYPDPRKTSSQNAYLSSWMQGQDSRTKLRVFAGGLAGISSGILVWQIAQLVP